MIDLLAALNAARVVADGKQGVARGTASVKEAAFRGEEGAAVQDERIISRRFASREIVREDGYGAFARYFSGEKRSEHTLKPKDLSEKERKDPNPPISALPEMEDPTLRNKVDFIVLETPARQNEVDIAARDKAVRPAIVSVSDRKPHEHAEAVIKDGEKPVTDDAKSRAQRLFTSVMAGQTLVMEGKPDAETDLVKTSPKSMFSESRDIKAITEQTKPSEDGPALKLAPKTTPTPAPISNLISLREYAGASISLLTDIVIADRGPAKLSLDNILHETVAGAQNTKPSSSVTAQIAGAIRADRGGTNIEVRLEPPELGRVRIDLTVETADSVKAVLSADRGETLEHLRRHIGQLMHELKESGFSSIDLEFSEKKTDQLRRQASDMRESFGSAEEAGQEIRNIVYLKLRDAEQLDLLV